MRSTPLLLLLLTSPAFAAEDTPLRFSTLATWVVMLVVLIVLLTAWSRTREWVDANVFPALTLLSRTASPPRIRAWGDAVTPALLGEEWLIPGGVHWINGDPAALSGLVAELLATEGVVLAVHVSPERQALIEVDEALAGRVFLCLDPPEEPVFAALATRGRRTVLLTDSAPSPDCVAAGARWEAITVLLSTTEPGTPGLAGTRSLR